MFSHQFGGVGAALSGNFQTAGELFGNFLGSIFGIKKQSENNPDVSTGAENTGSSKGDILSNDEGYYAPLFKINRCL